MFIAFLSLFLFVAIPDDGSEREQKLELLQKKYDALQIQLKQLQEEDQKPKPIEVSPPIREPTPEPVIEPTQKAKPDPNYVPVAASGGSAALIAILGAIATALRKKQQPNQEDNPKQETEEMTVCVGTHMKRLPSHGNVAVRFVPRSCMEKRHFHASAHLPRETATAPITLLPVDCTNNMGVSVPMDGNDQLGDCMEAMACHVDGIWTYGRGQSGWTQSIFSLSALEQQYEKASGGDNGLDEPTLLQQCWKPGLAGIPAATYVDSLDVDVTNIPLAQYLIDQFFHINMMWSVPDNFLQNFSTGSIWPNAGNPDPNLGHGTPLTDIGGPNDKSGNISLNGFYRLVTWGGWAWVSPAFVASVQPGCFVCFSARQFNPKTGYDAHGRHITTQAAVWKSIGGNVIPASVINSFPPISPGPTPAPPTPVPGNFTPPFSIWVAGIQIPLLTFPDLTSATTMAQMFATAAGTTVEVDVKDSLGAVALVINGPTPVPPVPVPPIPVPPTPGNGIAFTISATLNPGSYEIFPSGTLNKFKELSSLMSALTS